MSVDLREKGIALLSTTTVSLASTGATTLYTVPTAKRCVLHCAVFVAGADAAASAFTVGQVGALTDFLSAGYTNYLSAPYDAGTFIPPPSAYGPKIKSYAAGTVIQINVTTAAGGATNTIYLFGFLT